MNNWQSPFKTKQLRHTVWSVSILALLALPLLPEVAVAQKYVIDPQAEKLLKSSLDYLSGLTAFSVDTRNTVDETLESGQIIQDELEVSVTVQRPNKMYTKRHDDFVHQSLYYDGKTVTLFNATKNYYASVAAPDSIESMLGFINTSLGFIAPASDFLYRDAFPLMMQNVYSAIIVGKTSIGGVPCVHLAFSRPDIDFQIWIPETGEPLPSKYVVTDKMSFGYPSTDTVMSNWNTKPNISDATFSFVAPKGAQATNFTQVDTNITIIQ